MKNSFSFDILHIQKVFTSLIGGREKRNFRKFGENCNLSALMNFASFIRIALERLVKAVEHNLLQKYFFDPYILKLHKNCSRKLSQGCRAKFKEKIFIWPLLFKNTIKFALGCLVKAVEQTLGKKYCFDPYILKLHENCSRKLS